MSILFVVCSEGQLRIGMPWCLRLADQTASSFHLVVAGKDSGVLLKHAESTVAAQIESSSSLAEKPTVCQISEDAGDILDHADAIGCRNILLIRSSHGKALQTELFQRSRHIVLWIQTSTGPPVDHKQVLSVLDTTHGITDSITNRFLGLTTSDVMCRDLNPSDGDTKQHIQCVLDDFAARTFTEEDLLCLGVITPEKGDFAYDFGLALFAANLPASVALISDGDSIGQAIGRSFSNRITNWVASVAPPMERDERIQLVANLEKGSVPNLEFLGLISASSMLAAFGLLQDSAAVIIGAMLIAPLMTPILGAGLSLAYGNRPLFKSALLTILLGFVGALGASILFGFLVLLVRPTSDNHLDWMTSEMWSRCRPSPLDFCVGLVGGLAASYAQTRQHLSSALAGAAIAAALVPPLSTAGLQIAFGIWGDMDPTKVPEGVLPIVGPLLLVCVNVLTIMIGASLVLWSRGMRNESSGTNKAKWVPRVIALLLILTSLILVSLVGPDMIFPSDR